MGKKQAKNSETKEYIEKILTILENNFANGKIGKMELGEIYYLIKELYTLFNSYFMEDEIECSKLARKRYLPLLKLMESLDRDNYSVYRAWEKNATRISARTSLEDYFIFREWDAVENTKNLKNESILYANRKEYIRGYIHYLEKITTDPNFRILIANFPSGYGKSYPEKISEAWNFGVDPTGTVLYLCSNDNVAKGGSVAVRNEIKSEWFGEVFPHMKFDKEDKEYFKKETESNWTLRDCKLASSYYAFTTNSNVVGVRASQRIHIDDLYKDYKEALNENLNSQYFYDYTTVWQARFVQSLPPKIVITGTLWYSHDFIAKVINSLREEHKFSRDKKYPYTYVSEDGSCAIVQVPALDYKTGLSVAPHFKTTAEIQRIKKSIPSYLFETNYQQRPIDPESLAFSYDKLKTYDVLPSNTNEIPYSFAVIDATRKGKDYFAMPIFKPIKDGNAMKYYLVDAIFTKKATKDMYEPVVEKILRHHITKLVIETNVTSEFSNAIRSRLPVQFCGILEKYNTVKKEIRIQSEQTTMVEEIVYPKQSLYGINSDVGQFMYSFTSYNLDGNNEHDDANDSVAMFCHEIIDGGAKTTSIVPMRRPF